MPGTAGFPFTFGPQIKSNSLTQITPQQYQFTNVAYLVDRRYAAFAPSRARKAPISMSHPR